jgi:hypothetical protein
MNFLYHGTAEDLNIGEHLLPDAKWARDTGEEESLRVYLTRYYDFAMAFALRNLSCARPDVVHFRINREKNGNIDTDILQSMPSGWQELFDLFIEDNIGWLPWESHTQPAFVYTVQRPARIFGTNNRWILERRLDDEEYYSKEPIKILDKKIITPESFLQSGKNKLTVTYACKNPKDPADFIIERLDIKTILQLQQHANGK